MSSQQNISAIVLAAGASSRMGKSKQLLTYNGLTLIDHAISAVSQSGCGEVYVVIGAGASEIRGNCNPLAAHFVENLEWREGIASSIRAGLSAATRENAGLEAVLISLVDQPLVDSQILLRLVEGFVQKNVLAIASEYAGSVGVPAVFSSKLYSELLSLHGEEGAKKVLIRHQDNIVRFPVLEAAFDIDVSSDYEALLRRQGVLIERQ